MKRFVPLGLALALVTVLPSSVVAQPTGVLEFGLDAGFAVSFIDDEEDAVVAVGLPSADFSRLLQNLRVGYFTTPAFEVETSLGFSYLSQGGDSVWRLGLGLDGLYHPGGTGELPAGGSFFVRFGGLVDVIGNDSNTNTQLGIAAGLGTKLPLGPRWALRAEAGGARRFEADDQRGRWDLVGSVGFSFFTDR
jgi:hypothetical protein